MELRDASNVPEDRACIEKSQDCRFVEAGDPIRRNHQREQIVEGKLAQQLGVGQGLIREALIELEHQGFVQRTPFAGTQVTELSIEDAQHIYELRIELEPLAFFLAGPSVQGQQLAELREIAERTKIASKAETSTRFLRIT